MSDSVHKTTKAVYAFIRQYIEANGLAPTIREITIHCYLSVGTTMRHLDRLEALGWITRKPGFARGIILTHTHTEIEPE